MDKISGIDSRDKSAVDFPGSDSAKRPRVWSSSFDPGHKADIGNSIFCNRPLNMKNIAAIGFDMNYTLAQYNLEEFELLVYEQTVQKLVSDWKYPEELRSWSFAPNYMVRGLVLDKKRGNILKMDCHNYVKVAYHGFKELSKEAKFETYQKTFVADPFHGPGYAHIDTLFSIAEAYLFAQLVDFKDKNPEKTPNYALLYKDVQNAKALCHRDGTLKQRVAVDAKRYINEDSSIVPMLKMLRDSGRSTFLVTNSLWDYTNVVMSFLCGSGTTFDWLQYFDVVITGSAKPGFFLDGKGANLFEVEPESGVLLNTNNGSPLPQVGNVSARVVIKDKDRARKVFQGGSVGHLHSLLSIESSSQVLYVGDHIYGDIIHSKKTLGWRTMLVIPELEREVKLLWELRDRRKELLSLRNKRDRIEGEIRHLLNESIKLQSSDHTEQKLNSELEELKLQRESARSSYQNSLRMLHLKFNEPWGQLMETGCLNTRFAHQVERFACLYTSQVTNLGLFSPDEYYTPSEDFMQRKFGILEG